VGADQHIQDPDDRIALAVLAYELHAQYGSLAKVREHLASHDTTVRICGRPRLFSITTIREWISEGRAAEQYIELLDIAQARVDSDYRLSLLGAVVHDRLRVHGAEDWDTLLKIVDQLRKLERDRMDLLGLKAPIKIQNVPAGTAEIPADMVAAVAAARERAQIEQRALVEDAYPGPHSVPAPRDPTQRPRRTRRNPPTERNA
jgi:hypothetical protein